MSLSRTVRMCSRRCRARRHRPTSIGISPKAKYFAAVTGFARSQTKSLMPMSCGLSRTKIRSSTPIKRVKHGQDGKECPPAESDGQRNTNRKVRRDGEAIGGENDAHDRGAARFRPPADHQLDVSGPDRGVEEPDDDAQHHEFGKVLHEHLDAMPMPLPISPITSILRAVMVRLTGDQKNMPSP